MTRSYRGRLRFAGVAAMAALLLTACGVPLQESPEPLQSDVIPAALSSSLHVAD